MQVFRNFSCRNMLCTFLCNYVHQVICCKSMWQEFFIFNLLFNFVISSSKFPDVSKNQNLCTPDFFKNTIHQSQCEPYDEQSFKKKNSFIKFFVSKKMRKRNKLSYIYLFRTWSYQSWIPKFEPMINEFDIIFNLNLNTNSDWFIY